MAEPLERNSLELGMAFHNAVSRFQDWTANVAEPKVRLHGRFRPISEVCEEVAKTGGSAIRRPYQAVSEPSLSRRKRRRGMLGYSANIVCASAIFWRCK